MPILKQQIILAIARNIKAFLNLEAGITRSGIVPGFDSASALNNSAARVHAKFRRQNAELVRSRQQLASKEQEVATLRSRLSSGTDKDGTKKKNIKPENMIWIFGYGHGRCGTTWLSSMLRNLDGYSVWVAPMVGKLFGHFYYSHSIDDRVIGWERQREPFILSDRNEIWLGPMRSFILDNTDAKFSQAAPLSHLVINEAHGSEGAPLIMKALPESSMILLIRDPRDQMASLLDGRKKGSWIYERRKEFGMKDSLADNGSDTFVETCTQYNLLSLGNARQAYEAHQGPKALVRYEDLVADTLGTMRRLCSDLGLAVDEEELARAVEKHSWENIPEENKGEGRFYRKGTPGGWKKDLTPEQANIVEKAAAPVLDWFYSSAAGNGAAQHPFVFRPGTFDEAVFRSVSVRNEYELPEAFRPDDIIVDIGVHIGSFSYAALQRGSDHVYGFEAEKSNYACAVRNLRSFGDRVRLHNKAVWRSDRVGDKLSFIASTDESNTAGGNVLFADTGEEVETAAFDDIIREVTNGGEKRVRMLKMDCEGSEFPILLTSQTLHLIDEIRGEYHEFGGDYDPHSIPEVARVPGYARFTIEELTDALEQAGFSVTSSRSRDTNLGHFFATRIS